MSVLYECNIVWLIEEELLHNAGVNSNDYAWAIRKWTQVGKAMLVIYGNQLHSSV